MMNYFGLIAVAVLFFIGGWLGRDLPETAVPISEVQADVGVDWSKPIPVYQHMDNPEVLRALCDTRHHKPGGPSDYVTFISKAWGSKVEATWIYKCTGDGR